MNRIGLLSLVVVLAVALGGACTRKEMRDAQNELKSDLKREGRAAIKEAINGESADSAAAGSDNKAACERACEVAGDAEKNPDGITKCKAAC
jgi:hypothetical protein